MPEDMPDRMLDRMPEDMSDRMPEDLPVRKCINVMVGVTRSKVIFFKRGVTNQLVSISSVFEYQPKQRHVSVFYTSSKNKSQIGAPYLITIVQAAWSVRSGHYVVAAYGGVAHPVQHGFSSQGEALDALSHEQEESCPKTRACFFYVQFMQQQGSQYVNMGKI